MATQRLLIATIAGDAARAIAALFRRWQSPHANGGCSETDRQGLDEFCDHLSAHCLELPIVYFSEWVDRWQIGDLIADRRPLQGHRFEAWCAPSSEVAALAARCPAQFQEQRWLAARLREAADAWQPLAGPSTVVVVRQVLGASVSDEEVRRSFEGVPSWLTAFAGRTNESLE